MLERSDVNRWRLVLVNEWRWVSAVSGVAQFELGNRPKKTSECLTKDH